MNVIKELEKKSFSIYDSGKEDFGDGDLLNFEDAKDVIVQLLNPWKDASKEKPEEREEEFSSLTIDVFILIEGKSATNGYYNHKDESWCHYGDHEIGPVTHWMYIPEIQGE